MKKNHTGKKTIIFIICVILAILSVMPFVIMIVNSTRSTTQIQQHAVSFIPSTYALKNFQILTGKSFNPAVGLMNSLIVSVGVTALATYFSSMTAYALVIYEWKLRDAFFSFIMAIMMIPAQITLIPAGADPAGHRLAVHGLLHETVPEAGALA